MTLNVDKHKDALVAAWKEVMDERHPTDWALFGYDGLSYDLNVVSKGDGGLEELNDEFNSGKIMYALCRVKIKEKNVEKIVLINWQGEGAPLARKGTCANHVGEVKSFFKGIHVTINARTDEDVESDIILSTVAKATAGDGVKVSMASEMETNVGPVGTVYKRVNPKEDINSAAKDEFWRKEEQEEERRKREEQNKHRKFSQNEVKLLRRESQDYFNEAEKAPAASPTPKMNGSNNITSAAAVKASTPMKNSGSNAGDLVRQRIKNFDMGTPPAGGGKGEGQNGSGVSNGNGLQTESLSVLKRRQMFEGGTVSSTSLPRLSAAQEIKKAQEEAQKLQKKQDNGLSNPTINQVESSPNPPPTTKHSPLPPTPPQQHVPDVVPQATKPTSPTPPPPVVVDTVDIVRVENTNGHSKIETSISPDLGTSNELDTLVVETSQAREEDAATPTIEILPEMGICARALYDYQAADESEITFDPNDLITNIEKIDEGWWEGLGPNGVYGLFPANYVELLN